MPAPPESFALWCCCRPPRPPMRRYYRGADCPRQWKLLQPTADGVPVMIRDVEAAYRDARFWAREVSTVRLRFAERRLRSHRHRLTSSEQAQLAGLRDELRDRGVEVPDLWSA